MTNSPVLAWVDGQPIDLVGVTLACVGAPLVIPADGGYSTEFRLAVQLEVPEIKLAVSPSWPHDYHPDPIHSSRVIGRSLLPMDAFWNGAAVGVAADWTLGSNAPRGFNRPGSLPGSMASWWTGRETSSLPAEGSDEDVR